MEPASRRGAGEGSAHGSGDVGHLEADGQADDLARADFAPRIVSEGYLNDFQQSSPRGHADLALGFIKLEWGLFEGGRRVAELRLADSKVRSAVAQADSGLGSSGGAVFTPGPPTVSTPAQPTVPGFRAKIVNGLAYAPAEAPPQVQRARKFGM